MKLKELYKLQVLALLCLVPFVAAQQVQRNPIVRQDLAHVTTTVPLRDMPSAPWHNLSKLMPEHDRSPIRHIGTGPDTVSQTEILPPVGTTNILSFDGITGSQGGGFVPPDTNASVGTTQVVETVNIAYAVYDKATGSQIMAPKSIQTLYTPLGGQCATGNLSDPVVNFDKAAQRWVITMIAFNNTFSVNNSCVAVSTSSDATGTYHVYAFAYGNVLPDYPKVGVWPDAYYLTSNNFPNGGSFSGAETCALNRANMLLGNAATSICFKRGTSDFSLLPADLDGATPPPSGSPNYHLELATSTRLNLFKFHVDFVTPTNSTFTGPTALTVASYTDACASTGNCIPQPSPGTTVDSLGDRLMFRLAYRHFTDHEALVATHSIRGAGRVTSAVRWYEIRSPGSAPVIFQSGTVNGASSTALWMGSIGTDKVGDIALGYSKSSRTVKPTVEYTGRVPSDTLGTMESPSVIVTGTGVQTSAGGGRWGDYSSMAIDPSDDCTFWYTQEYYRTNGANWSTRLASFKFTACQ